MTLICLTFLIDLVWFNNWVISPHIVLVIFLSACLINLKKTLRFYDLIKTQVIWFYSASFGLFLVLLVLASTRTEGSEMHRRNLRGPAPTVVEWLIFFWVTGMVIRNFWHVRLYLYIAWLGNYTYIIESWRLFCY